MNNTITTPDMKRGDAFTYEATILVDGQLTDIPIEDIRSQVRTKTGILVGECSVERISTGKYKFFVMDTNTWPIGIIEFDFEMVVNGIAQSSPTYSKTVVKDITRPIVEVVP